jgi:endonuclease/exonuclease/phosphatase family metal-dependent hydrolase
MRIASYNIKALRQDRAAVVAVLRDLDADVIGIQESTHWPLRRRRLSRLARDAGLEVAVTGWGARETAMLVRPGLDVTERRRIPLPWTPGRTRRGIAAATVSGVPVIVVHLSLDPAERQRHLATVQAAVVRCGPGRAVVVGDLNEGPGGVCWVALTAHLTDAAADAGPTFPSSDPGKRIDGILVGARHRVIERRVRHDEVTRLASDHCPLYCDIAPDDIAPDRVDSSKMPA